MPKLSFVKDMKREVLYHFPEGSSKAGSAPVTTTFLAHRRGAEGSRESSPVLFVDLDHTIIRPKSGRVHPKGADDWQYLYPCVIPILKDAIDDGYLIYVISNQSSLLEEKKKEKLAEMIEKLNAVFAPIVDDVDPSPAHAKSLYIGVSCGGNYYRKPHTGLFRLLEEEGGVKVDLRRSIFCGDALGRTAKESSEEGKADFSASDYYFALNCGIPRVYSPGELFMVGTGTHRSGGDKSFSEVLKRLNPYEPAPRVLKRDFMDKFGAAETKEKRDMLFGEIRTHVRLGRQPVEGAGASQVMIVLTGSPASGKSTLVKHLCSSIPTLACYSGDELKTRLEKSVKDGLKAGKSVLIDSTNPSREARKKWIDLAKAMGATPISVYIPYDEEMTHHLQHFRIEESEGAVEALPEIAIRVFKSKYERPYKVEGFEAVYDYTPYITFPKKSKQEENFQKYY
jgi:bifunctional polynucleotide phosphatase/kinase